MKRPYECIFRFFVASYPSRCWVRLYPALNDHTIAILSEVPGNLGPEVTEGVEVLAAELVARFYLQPQRVLWLEHYPSDALNTAVGVYERVHLHWEVRQLPPPGQRRGYFHSPAWQPLGRCQVEQLTGLALPEHPFWRYERNSPDGYAVCVGGRLGQVWPSSRRRGGWWGRASGHKHEPTLYSPQVYLLRQEAQQWVLDTLATLAQEFDDLPDGEAPLEGQC